MPQFVNETTVFNSPVSFNILPRRNIDKFPLAATIINANNIEHFTTHNTGAVTVTEFTKGTRGQEITLLGDDNTTIQENASIITNIGDILLEAGHVYKFVNFDEIWYYVCCDTGGGSGGTAVPLIVEGSVADKIGYFHNTNAGAGFGVRFQNDGPLTNYTIKASDPAGAGFFQIYAKRVVQFGPEASTLEAAILTLGNGHYLSIEGDATYMQAGIYLTSGDHLLTSMLYMTGGDRGMRLSWNYREPYQSGGTQMHSDPNYPVIQTQWETDGAFGLEYTRKFTTSAGTYDSLPGKSWKLFGAGNPAVTDPNNGQKDKYILMACGEPGRGFDLGIETAGDGTGYGTRIRIDDSTNADPIYLWVNGALRQVKSFNDGAGHKVLYY
jgi:hypothetical protein